MKKLGFLFFVSALAIGLISAASSCSVGNFNFKNMSGVQGSGNAKSETRNVSGFNEIEANGAISAQITVGDSFNVVIETDDNLLTYVKTEVNGDTLKIYTEGRISPKTKTNVKISMPALDKLDINGASSVNVADVKGDSLEIKANGASEVQVTGETKNFSAEANGASTVNAENLAAENADVDSNGASTITVSPVNELNAEASGASTVYYKGEPKSIKQSSSGVSSIKKKAD